MRKKALDRRYSWKPRKRMKGAALVLPYEARLATIRTRLEKEPWTILLDDTRFLLQCVDDYERAWNMMRRLLGLPSSGPIGRDVLDAIDELLHTAAAYATMFERCGRKECGQGRLPL